MRAPVLLLVTVLASGAAACATVEPPGPAPSPPAASARAPAPVADHDWFFHQDDADARLVYGVPESDDMRLGLDCTRSSGRLVVSAIAERGAKPEIQLEAGGETGRFPAASEPSQLHDGVFLTAEAAAGAPVFRRFRQSGWITLLQDGGREAFVPYPGSAPHIERFFAFCG